MKFTKQEQSLIKIAAAHMAPQMVKKATLQSKLAEYGIGLTKEAGWWSSFAQTVQDANKKREQYGNMMWGDVLTDVLNERKKKKEEEEEEKAAESGKETDKDKKPEAEQKKAASTISGTRSILASYGIGLTKQADLGAIPLSEKELTPVAAGGQAAPRIGEPAPYHFWKDDNWDKKVNKYPYFASRFINGQGILNMDQNWNDALLFDRALRSEINQGAVSDLGGHFTQGAVDRARGAQAQELAGRVAKPNTDAYNDAVQMLIQAGKNNQEAFETSGRTPPQYFDSQKEHNNAPRGYFGPNRLKEKQMEQLRNYYPLMGDTTNPRRFSNLS